MAQILQSLSYKVSFIIPAKFNSFELFILILGTSAIMDHTACCYNMTTSEIGLYGKNPREREVFVLAFQKNQTHFHKRYESKAIKSKVRDFLRCISFYSKATW